MLDGEDSTSCREKPFRVELRFRAAVVFGRNIGAGVARVVGEHERVDGRSQRRRAASDWSERVSGAKWSEVMKKRNRRRALGR